MFKTEYVDGKIIKKGEKNCLIEICAFSEASNEWICHADSHYHECVHNSSGENSQFGIFIFLVIVASFLLAMIFFNKG